MRTFSCLLFFVLVTTVGCRAAERDFNSVVSGLESHYQVHAQKVPMMGMVSLIARVATHGGVKGLRIAEFEHITADADTEHLFSVVRSSLDEGWQPFVTERSGHGGEQTVIFVRPCGDDMRMLIAEYDHSELSIVRLEMNGSELAKWARDPKGETRRVREGDSGDEERAYRGEPQ
jgi:hypothetical protein